MMYTRTIPRGLRLWLVAAWATSCAPIDDRSDGPLNVAVRDLPPTIDRVVVTVSTPDADRAFELAPESASADLFVQSVPSGPVDVRADGFVGGEFVASRRQRGDVQAGAVATVVLSFAASATDGGVTGIDGGVTGTDGDTGVGPDEVVSPAIVYIIPQVNEDAVTEATIAVEVDGDNPALQDFLTRAPTSLGRAPSQVWITAATLSFSAGSPAVTGLDDVFSSVELVVETDTVEATVATGVPTGAGPLTMTVVPAESVWPAVTPQILTFDFDLRLRGPTPRSSTVPFTADLLLSVTFAAR